MNLRLLCALAGALVVTELRADPWTVGVQAGAMSMTGPGVADRETAAGTLHLMAGVPLTDAFSFEGGLMLWRYSSSTDSVTGATTDHVVVRQDPSVSAGLRARLPLDDTWSLTAIGGLSSWASRKDETIILGNGAAINDSRSASGLDWFYGLGARYRWLPDMEASLDVEHYNAGIADGGRDALRLDTISLGAQWAVDGAWRAPAPVSLAGLGLQVGVNAGWLYDRTSGENGVSGAGVPGGRVGVSYAFGDGFAVEAVHESLARMTFSRVGSSNVESVDLAGNRLGFVARMPLSPQWQGAFHAGVFSWRAGMESPAGANVTVSALDPYMGGGVSRQIDPHWSVGADLTLQGVHQQQLALVATTLSATLEYHFGEPAVIHHLPSFEPAESPSGECASPLQSPLFDCD